MKQRQTCRHRPVCNCRRSVCTHRQRQPNSYSSPRRQRGTHRSLARKQRQRPSRLGLQWSAELRSQCRWSSHWLRHWRLAQLPLAPLVQPLCHRTHLQPTLRLQLTNRFASWLYSARLQRDVPRCTDNLRRHSVDSPTQFCFQGLPPWCSVPACNCDTCCLWRC